MDANYRDVQDKIYLNITNCPYCNRKITTQETTCPHCHTRVRYGRAQASDFMLGETQFRVASDWPETSEPAKNTSQEEVSKESPSEPKEREEISLDGSEELSDTEDAPKEPFAQDLAEWEEHSKVEKKPDEDKNS